MLLTISRLYLCLSQTYYQIHTTIQDHKLIVIQLMYQHLLVQTNMHFLMRLFIHMTVQHHIPRIQLLFKEVDFVYALIFKDYLMDTSTPLNDSSSSVISGITTQFSFLIIDQNYYLIKTVFNFNHKNVPC